MAIAEREAMSHGATSRVPKLEFASTTLPLLMIVRGFDADAISWAFRGFIRDVDVVELTFSVAFSVGPSVDFSPSEPPDSGTDNRLLFLDLLVYTSSPNDSELELSELDDFADMMWT